MNSIVLGLFDDRETAYAAVKDLEAGGFIRDQISLVANDWDGEWERFKAGGPSTGVSLLGYLSERGAIYHPESRVLLSGPIAASLAGANGTPAGGPMGALVSLGVPSNEAQHYAEAIRRGATLVGVSAAGADADRAQAVLDRDGAADIESRAEYYRQQGFTVYDQKAAALSRAEAVAEAARYGQFASTIPASRPVIRVRRYGSAYADGPVVRTTTVVR